jgi:hypothetical protein
MNKLQYNYTKTKPNIISEQNSNKFSKYILILIALEILVDVGILARFTKAYY